MQIKKEKKRIFAPLIFLNKKKYEIKLENR